MTVTLTPAHIEHDWANATLIGFDTETTGTNIETDRIVTASIADPNGKVDDYLINPGIDIPDHAAEIHGVTTEHAKAHGEQPQQALQRIHETLQQHWSNNHVIVGHNIAFDLSILHHEMLRHGLGGLTISGNVIDTLVLDKHVDTYRRGKRTLETLANVYNVSLTNAHTADADALAAVHIAQTILHAKFRHCSAEELHSCQTDWAHQQQTGLQKYFDSKGIDTTVKLGWPVFTTLG